MRKLLELSPNFSKKTRKSSSIKFIIIHYTGMQSEIASIQRLKNKKAKVSCHYLINRKGKIIQMVPENKTAWHAGISSFNNEENCNDYSLGIELIGSDTTKFSKDQYDSLKWLINTLKSFFPEIKSSNVVGHSDIAPGRKTDPGPFFDWTKIS